MLVRLNRELGANFNVDNFRHVAVYDEEHQWIEMRLVSCATQHVRVDDLDLEVIFEEGEVLRTEISAKFTAGGVNVELAEAGMRVIDQWTDEAGDFLLTLAGVSA